MDIQLLILRSPAIYPAAFLIRFRLVLLACSGCQCIDLRKQLRLHFHASTGSQWQVLAAGLSRLCDGAAV